MDRQDIKPIDLLETIVVEISRDGQTGCGTGFYISENEIATCYHVLVPEGDNLKNDYWIRHDSWGKNWKKAKPIEKKCRSLPDDIAILQSDSKLSAAGNLDFRVFDAPSHFKSRGYDESTGDNEFGANEIQGEIIARTSLYEERCPRLQLSTPPDSIRPGRSGSPILSISQEAIVGMIDYQGGLLDRDAQIGTAIPIESLIPDARLSEVKQTGKLLNVPLPPPKEIIDYSQYIKIILNEYNEMKTSIGFYIPIYLTEKPLNFLRNSKKDKHESVLAKQILLNRNHLIILADPGSGKSCLLNQLATEIINNSSQIPIIIKAKYWGFTFNTIPQAIEYELKSFIVNINNGTIINELNTDNYVILIDGYDEIRNSKVLFESEIISLARTNKVKIILTSREANYHGELPNFEVFEINKLSNDQIDKYAKHIISFNFFSHYLDELNLLDLARLPLYLFMLCSNATDNKELPRNKAILHDKFAIDLLEGKLLFKRIPDYQPKSPLQSKLQFLSKLAEKKTIDPLYNNYLQCLKEMNIIDDAATLMQEILESGILKGNYSSFDFIHPTVREFFYARLISSYESPEIIEFLEDYHDNDEILDIILFLVGIPKAYKKQREILDFLESNDLQLYVKCLASRYINLEDTNNYPKFEYNYLSQLQRSYNSLLEKFFSRIKFRFVPYYAIPLDQLYLTTKLNVQVVGYIDVPNLHITYGYKFTNISDNFEPLVMSKKSFSPKFEDGTSFYKSTSIPGLDLDSAREMAINDIRGQLKNIIDGRWLINPMDVACEMIVAGIKKIASTASMFVDKSLEPLWKFRYGIYDAREYYDAFNSMRNNPYISWGTAPKRFFELEGILAHLEYLIKNDISLKDLALPQYFLDSNSQLLGDEMEKRLVLRLTTMYSILPERYLNVVDSNFPELRKYMRHTNRYPFKCIVRYRYGIDFTKKGLIRDTLGETSVYFKPIPVGEELTASVEKANPDISREEFIKLNIEYENNLKSLGRYSKNDYFQISNRGVSEIIDNLALTNALYELLNEDLEWFLNDR